MNKIVRKGKFDSAHRVMNEHLKCFNVHGHCYKYELEFSYKDEEALGYAIDFKEIKRVACQWLDDTFDHACILNPKDESIIKVCEDLKSRVYLMKLVDSEGYCNPSAENMAKEIFFAISILMNDENLKLEKVTLYETENCYVLCEGLDGKDWDRLLASKNFYAELFNYKQAEGRVEYDDRKL
jgi:6-pyruvoyltetrahydropterin/6-carboxytetrahydropterin synthase